MERVHFAVHAFASNMEVAENDGENDDTPLDEYHRRRHVDVQRVIEG